MDRKIMRFGSVCSGIEAASVAWHSLGWKAAWFSEIEPFPSAVLAHYYPSVPNLGDMTRLPDLIRSGAVEVPDILCGGTPCQAFSVAGLRRSLDDDRGNLSLTFCEIADAIDEHRPSIIFWENVPGVLNTKDNAFGCFLAGLAGEDEALVPPGGRWTNAGFIDGPARAVAWRILDAQYFGVAQRRRRVFVVASARADFDPAAVLFEFDGVRWDSAPSRETGQKPAPCVTNGPPFSRTGNERVEAEAMVVQPYEVGNCLTARMHKGINSTLDEGQTPVLVGFNARQDPDCWEGRSGTPGTRATQGVAQAVGTDMYNGAITGDVAATLGTQSGDGVSSGPSVMQPSIGFQDDTTPKAKEESAYCLRQDAGGQGACVMTPTMVVRRLTPVECERLQGFPDGYTNIPWRGKPESPDGPRYKALGNSWAVPVVRWIGERISRAT